MKLEMPKMPSLPKRPSSDAKASKMPSMSGKMPPFLSDLFKDMRDRRLIVPAIALFVAILAVPVVLGADPEPAPPPPAVPVDAKAEAVSPAVLADQEVAVRDFKERLDELKEKNPFATKFAPKETTSTGPDDSGAGADPSDVPVGGTDPGAGTPLPTGGDTPSTTPTTPTVETHYFTFRMDVQIGKLGSRKKVEGVKEGDVLPDKKKPILLFLGTNEDLDEARFVVSRDVTGTGGDGKCAPDRNACQFLTLKKGGSQTFQYGPQGERYSIKVTDLYQVEIDKPGSNSGE